MYLTDFGELSISKNEKQELKDIKLKYEDYFIILKKNYIISNNGFQYSNDDKIITIKNRHFHIVYKNNNVKYFTLNKKYSMYLEFMRDLTFNMTSIIKKGYIRNLVEDLYKDIIDISYLNILNLCERSKNMECRYISNFNINAFEYDIEDEDFLNDVFILLNKMIEKDITHIFEYVEINY